MEPQKPMGDVDDLLFQDAREIRERYKGLPMRGSPFYLHMLTE